MTLVSTSRSDKILSKDVIVSHSDSEMNSCEAVGTNASILGEDSLSMIAIGTCI
jgi:hypothetical protein